MKALTIQQPHASLIADREKWVENRFRFMSYRGPLAIHAGKGTRYLSREELTEYTTGAVIAVADLVACVPLRPIMERCQSGVLARLGITVEDFLSHEHTEGPKCLILRDVRKLAMPIPAIGKQGLWEWDERTST